MITENDIQEYMNRLRGAIKYPKSYTLLLASTRHSEFPLRELYRISKKVSGRTKHLMFVDFNGDIFPVATASRPRQRAVGNITDKTGGLGSVDPWGFANNLANRYESTTSTAVTINNVGCSRISTHGRDWTADDVRHLASGLILTAEEAALLGSDWGAFFSRVLRPRVDSLGLDVGTLSNEELRVRLAIDDIF
jgi:hypothetical protein